MLTETLKAPSVGLFHSQPRIEPQILPGWTKGNSNSGNEEFTLLSSTGATVESIINLGEMLWPLVKESICLVNVSNFALAIYNSHSDVLAFPYFFRQGERVQPFSVKLSSNQGLVSHVLTSQTPLLIKDLSDAGITMETDPICSAHPIRSWLSVPIRNPVLAKETAQGIIIVWSHQPNTFTERHLRLLSTLGTQASTVIRTAWPHPAEDVHLEGILVERDEAIEVGELARRELARDLHDGPIQLVSALAMRLDFCRKALEKDPALMPEQITRMQELAERAIFQMRTLLFELRPIALETQGLDAALQVLLDRRQEMSKTTKLKLDIKTCQPDGEIGWQDTRTEAVVFAMVREAVDNALRHAQADHIEVCLKETPAAIHIMIVDDGKGFDADTVMRSYAGQGSLGIINVQERAKLIGGEIEIKSVLHQGTCITIVVPKNAKFDVV